MMTKVFINKASSISPNGEKADKPYLFAIEPDYKKCITDANQRRRMSRIVKMGVACGLDCINTYKSEDIDAIITSTSLGCLADTEKFMTSIINNKEKLINPTAFIYSTFNTIGSQIALMRKIHSYNMTYAHRSFSFESALIDGIMRIKEGDKNVLVGAIDEITETSLQIQKRLGLLKDTIAGEGANFFILSNFCHKSSLAELLGLSTLTISDSSIDIKDKITLFLKENGLKSEDIKSYISGENGNEQQDYVYKHIKKSLFPNASQENFKNECGEYLTASSYALWKAINNIKTKTDKAHYTFIHNHYQGVYHSFILIKNCL